MFAPLRKVMTNLAQHIKKQRHYFTDKGPSSQSYNYSSSQVWMWELDHKESWTPKNWCFWTVVLEKTVESPLGSKEIQPVHAKGNQSWIFIGKTGAEAEAPISCPPDVKNGFIWKDPDAGKDWRWEKETTEDEMVGWHHQWERHEFEQAPGVGDKQGSLTFSSLEGHKLMGTTERLSWLTICQDFPGGSVSKEFACNARDLGLIPRLGRSSAEGHGKPLQCSCLENPQEQRSLAACSLCGHKKSGTTVWLSTHTICQVLSTT